VNVRSTTRTSRRGFTLVEVLISLALMALLMTAAALGIQAAQTSHAYNTEKCELVARTRGVLDRMTREVRRSQSFTVLDARTVAVIVTSGYIHTYYWDGVQGGNMLYTVTDPVTITFDLPWGVPGTPVILTSGVQAFTVSDADPSCRVYLYLVGQRAKEEGTMTATPVKALF